MINELCFCHKPDKPLPFQTYLIQPNSEHEISKVDDIGLQRYREQGLENKNLWQ